MRYNLLALIFILSIALGYSQNQGTIKPVTSEYAKYLAKLHAGTLITKTNDGHKLGYVPSPVHPKFINFKKSFKSQFKSALPASYDLRTYSLVTPVENQGDCGSCWTFATMASLESRWLKLGLGTFSLSENNLNNCAGFEIPSCDGGDAEFAISYLSRLSGPVSTASDPYSDVAGNCKTGLTPVAYVTDARYLPPDINTVKQACMDFGGIYTTFYYTPDNSAFNANNNTYYFTDGSQSANHVSNDSRME